MVIDSYGLTAADIGRIQMRLKQVTTCKEPS